MKRMRFLFSAVAILAIMASCNKEESYSVSFEQTGYYFKWGGEPQTYHYTTHNVSSISVSTVTEGWTCTVDNASMSITITPPEDPGTEAEREELRTASAQINAVSQKGNTAQYLLNFYIIGDSDIRLDESSTYANCYVATVPGALYTFDATVKGPSGERIPTASVELLWQSKYGMIEHLHLNQDGTVSFYIDRLTDDDGEYEVADDGSYLIPDGNALIAALDASGTILWSWHIWAIDAHENPLENYDTYANGKSFMNKNLGAFANSKGATDDTDLILDSYGLYYQWGRKDPFARPLSYNCANNYDERLYNTSGSSVYVKEVETDATVGTVEYSIANPMTFITNAACVADDGDGIGDWLHSPDNSLWSDTSKSTYDPCPYGWRVPAKSDFDVLQLPADEDALDLDEARKRFGWMLSDGTNRYFYTGAGLRSYYDGIINNMNYKEGVYPSTPEPWEGYYWTTGVSDSGTQSTCMYFDLTTTRSINKFNLNYPSKRANAMQIRCVKM